MGSRKTNWPGFGLGMSRTCGGFASRRLIKKLWMCQPPPPLCLKTGRDRTGSDAGAQGGGAQGGYEAPPQHHHPTTCTQSQHGAGSASPLSWKYMTDESSVSQPTDTYNCYYRQILNQMSALDSITIVYSQDSTGPESAGGHRQPPEPAGSS